MGRENLAGMKFAHLLVLKRDEMKKSTHSYWLCQCDCGTICSVAGTHLKTGHTKSCGCYRKRKQVHGWLDLTGKRYGRLSNSSISVLLAGRTAFLLLCATAPQSGQRSGSFSAEKQ